MKFFFLVTLLVAMAFGAVDSGTAYYDDAAAVSALISQSHESFSYIVGIVYESGVGYNYLVYWNGSSYDDGAVDQSIASAIACGIISEETSWASHAIVIGYRDSDDAWEISTANARYMLANIDANGYEWARDYLFSHLVPIQ